jgi:hypothetical protein
LLFVVGKEQSALLPYVCLADSLRTLHHHTKLVFDDSLIDRIM